jgi:import inner membrane translocase subunit TIM13
MDAKTEVMQQVRQQAAIANARALVEVCHSHPTTTTIPHPISLLTHPPSGTHPIKISRLSEADCMIPSQKLNEHCFDRCIPTPGSSLSSGESTCYTNCMEKYMAAWNTTSRQYLTHVQKGAGGM